MMTALEYLDFNFMRRALAGGIALAVVSAPLGVFLVIRRMSLTSEAMAHAILPGVAIGYIIGGLSLPIMAVGGLTAGVLVALLAAGLARFTAMREETTLAGLYLIALALGAIILAKGASQLDLLHILFGNLLALDDISVISLATLAAVVLVLIALLYRLLIIETVEPEFLSVTRAAPLWAGPIFLGLVAAVLVAGFQTMGTLMGASLMILPAAGARLWSERIDAIIAIATVAGVCSVITGLVVAVELDLPAGPSVALMAGVFFFFSALAGTRGGVLFRQNWLGHLEG